MYIRVNFLEMSETDLESAVSQIRRYPGAKKRKAKKKKTRRIKRRTLNDKSRNKQQVAAEKSAINYANRFCQSR